MVLLRHAVAIVAEQCHDGVEWRVAGTVVCSDIRLEEGLESGVIIIIDIAIADDDTVAIDVVAVIIVVGAGGAGVGDGGGGDVRGVVGLGDTVE